MNLQKSSIFFGPGCDDALKMELTNICGIKDEALNERYLGLPTKIGRSKQGAFKHILEREMNKVQGFKGQGLSKAGKEVLIKSVLEAVPAYMMSCFSFSKLLCKQLTSVMARFWWGAQKGRRKVHWVSWEKLTQAKRDGGLGFRELESSIWLCWRDKVGG